MGYVGGLGIGCVEGLKVRCRGVGCVGGLGVECVRV